MKKEKTNKNIKLIGILLVLVVFGMFAIYFLNNSSQLKSSLGLDKNNRIEQISLKESILNENLFSDASLNSGAINIRNSEKSEVAKETYNVNSKEQKQNEIGFSNLDKNSPLLSDSVVLNYNKNIKKYPTRVDFLEGLEINSGLQGGGSLTGLVVGDDGADSASEFFDKYFSVFGIEKQNLNLLKQQKTGNLEKLYFVQNYNGLEVYFSFVLLSKSNNKWVLLNSNYFNDIVLNTRPKIGENKAIKSAKENLFIKSDVEKSELLIYPYVSLKGTEYFLVYKIDFNEYVSDSGERLKPSVFVDANSGKVIDVIDNIKEETAFGVISGEIFPDHFQQPKETRLFSNENVFSEELNTVTNENGLYSFENPKSTISTSFNGPYVNVFDYSQPVSSISLNLPPYENNINWKEIDGSYKQEQSNVFYHANKIHDFFTTGIEPFTINELDYPMNAYVEVPGFCNAYATGNSINFYQPGGGCEALSLSSDVIYHEYTHNMVFNVAPRLSSVYWGETGNMNEGYADYYACSLNDNTCMSDNFFSNIECLRNCENNKKYPEDYDDEPHYAAEIISGSIWDIRQEVGKEIADTLALVALGYDPQTFSELANNFIISDDSVYGNANLSDGTPHAEIICNSFYLNHGIYSDYCLDFLPILGKLTTKETISGRYFNITGTAGGNEFEKYILYYGLGDYPEGTEGFVKISEINQAVNNGNLYENFDVSLLDEGDNKILLSVFSKDGKSINISQTVSVDNINIDFPLNGLVLGNKENIQITGNITGNFESFRVFVSDSSSGLMGEEGISYPNGNDNEIFNGVVAEWDLSKINESRIYSILIEVDYKNKKVQEYKYIYIDTTLRKGWPKYIKWYSQIENWFKSDFNLIGKDNVAFFSIPKDDKSYKRIYSFNGTGIEESEFNGNKFVKGNFNLINADIERKIYYWGGLLEPVVADINNDGKNEVFVYAGGNPTKLYGFNEDGTNLQGFPVNMPNESDLAGGNLGTPSIADIDNDGYKEIIVNGYYYLYVVSYDGEIKNQIYLPIVSQPTTETVLADLNNDGSIEIIRKYDDIYQQDNWKGWQKLVVLNSSGSALNNWPSFVLYNTTYDGYNGYTCGAMGFESSPVIGNLDNDAEKEIIVATVRNVFDDGFDPRERNLDKWHCEGRIYAFNLDGSLVPGFPVDIDGMTFSIPSVGDINKDGVDEIIISSYNSGSEKSPNSGVYVIDGTGQILEGWPQAKGGSFWTASALADLNNDGYLEIAITSNYGQSYVFNYKGEILEGWPQHSMSSGKSSVIADINNDGKLEIVIGSSNGFFDEGILAFKLDGSSFIPGFPKFTQVDAQASPTIVDLDNNGKLELLASSDWDMDYYSRTDIYRQGTIYAWDLNQDYDTKLMPWKTLSHDSQHTGLFNYIQDKLASKITNKRNTNLKGNLIIKIQKNNNGKWEDYLTAFNNIVEVPAKSELELDKLFNSLNISISEIGDYKVYAEFLGKTSSYVFEVKVQTIHCTDSDNGKNYYLKGTASGIKLGADYFETYEDSCLDGNGDGNNLKEAFCVDDRVSFEFYNCVNGCLNGACIHGVDESFVFEEVSDDFIEVKTKLIDGDVIIPILYANGSSFDGNSRSFVGNGQDKTHKLALSEDNSLFYTAVSGVNEGFIASSKQGWGSNTYYLSATVTRDSDAELTNRTTIKNKVTGENVCQDLATGDFCAFNDAGFSVTNVGYSHASSRNATFSDASFNRIYSSSGDYLDIPIINSPQKEVYFNIYSSSGSLKKTYRVYIFDGIVKIAEVK